MNDADRLRGLILRWAPRHPNPDEEWERYLRLMGAYLEGKAEYASR